VGKRKDELLVEGHKEFGLQLRNPKTLITLVLFFLLITLVASCFILDRKQAYRPPVLSRSNPISQENQLPGTSAWQTTNESPYDDKTFRFPVIEGYARTTSAIAGDTVSFSVSTNQPQFTASIYRLGWYQGKGGRLLQTIPGIQGHFYPMPSMDPQTRLVEANWPVSFSIKIAPSWVTGMYVAKFTAAHGQEAYAPFVVRSVQSTDFVFIHAATTDEAYNNWGGKSLYDFNSTEHKRAYKVSFDRPFVVGAGFGYLLNWEYPMIRWLEKNGYNVGYGSTEDIHSDAALLKNHKGILVVGHNEYWSKEMKDNLESALDSGVNFANFAADTMGWQTRYEPSSSQNGTISDRIIVCYKDQLLDPFYEKDNSHVTVSPNNPLLNRPQQTLLGEMSGGQIDFISTRYDWVIADASSWVFNSTGLTNGDRLPGLVGYEYDKVSASYPELPGLDILASSPVHDIGTNMDDVSNATIYTALSGAEVFDAGSIHWSWGLDPFNRADGHANVVSQAAQKITANILQNFLTNGPEDTVSLLRQQAVVYAEPCKGNREAALRRKRAYNRSI
jgi:hypothetical protein